MQAYATTLEDIFIAITERINSVDFSFTYDKKLNVHYPGIGTDKTDLRFSYPGNILSIALPIDATELANYSINRGTGNGNVQVVSVRQDTAAQSTFAIRDRVDDYPSVQTTTELNEKGDETLRLFASPTTIPEIRLDGTQQPFLGSYWIGDRVRFSVDGGSVFSSLDGQSWRINEISVSISEEDAEQVTLKVGYA